MATSTKLITESVLSDAAIAEQNAFMAEAIKQIAQNVQNSSIVDYIDNIIYDWQQAGAPAKHTQALENDDLIYALGIAWGNAVIATHGWHWVDLTFHEFDNWLGRALVSADRSLMILPFAHIHECISGDDEVKISASISVIGSDVIPPIEPNAYINLMHNIQRIVPR